MCFPCPRALSRTANAAEIARSYWLPACRGVGDGYVQVRCSCSAECARGSSLYPTRAFNQFGRAGDRERRKSEEIRSRDAPSRTRSSAIVPILGIISTVSVVSRARGPSSRVARTFNFARECARFCGASVCMRTSSTRKVRIFGNPRIPQGLRIAKESRE